MRRRLSACLLTAACSLAAAAAALPAAAQAPDAPIATSAARATPGGGPSTADQIQQYLDATPAACERVASLEPLPDRKPHGEVGVAVGTGGYRSAYAAGEMPVGENGRVSVAVSQSQGRGWRGQRYRNQSLALGFEYSRPDPRLTRALEDEQAQRANACEAARRWMAGSADRRTATPGG